MKKYSFKCYRRVNFEAHVVHMRNSPDPIAILPYCLASCANNDDDFGVGFDMGESGEDQYYFIENTFLGNALKKHVGSEVEIWGDVFEAPDGTKVISVKDFLVLNKFENPDFDQRSILFTPKGGNMKVA